MTTACTNLLKQEFPSIDDEMKQYIEGDLLLVFVLFPFLSRNVHYEIGVLVSGVEDFESSDDLYDAIGAILHEVSVEKSENDIKDLCEQLLCLMKPQDSTKKGAQKVLDAPINLAQMAANLQINAHDVSSIWVINRDDNLVCNGRV